LILNAQNLADGDTITADVAIVGAGAAGITLAVALRDSGLSVVLLESGGYSPTSTTQDLYQGTMSGLNTWDLGAGTRLRFFGGSTNAWAGWCRPLEEDDFEARAWIPHSGWPTTYAELRPFYERAHSVCELASFDYDPVSVAAELGVTLLDLDPTRVQSALYQFSPPTRFGMRYRDALAAASDITVYLNANLTNLVQDSVGGAITRLQCSTLDNTSFTVEAQRYVLAMGGIETPRVMLASRDHDPRGVANSSGLVGCYFQEHPHYYFSGSILNVDSVLDFYTSGAMAQVEVADEDPRSVLIRGALTLPRAVREAEGIPNLGIELLAGSLDDDTGAITMRDARTLVPDSASPGMGLGMTLRVEQTPLKESRLTLRDDDLDALGMPRVDLDWRIREEDRIGNQRALDVLGAEFGRAKLGRVWQRLANGLIDREPLPGSHHMGTVRMHADPTEGVVDGNARCHDVSNLYIAGSSLFTTSGYANPTLTICALALRLADHLKETP